MNTFKPTTIASRNILRSPGPFLTRVFAVIGAILLLERTLSYSVYRNYRGLSYPLEKNSYGKGNAGGLEQQIGNLITHPGDTSSASGPRKAIIVASTSKDNTSWIRENFSDWELYIYVTDDSTADLTVLKKEGREAAVFLTYIITRYYELPDYMVFLHAKRYQWHNDDPMYDGVPPVKNLRLERVAEEGYQSLRCAWYPGCPLGVEPHLTVKENMFGTRKDYARAFKSFFPDDTLPSKVSAPCCSQFAVSREQVHQRALQEYERFRMWLWTVKIGGGKSGRVLEYMWHYIFSKPAVHCPSVPDCYCKTFGMCNLKCPDKTKCRGRYIMPPWNSPMDTNWPNQGPGEHGWPKNKWWEAHYPPSQWDGFEPKNKQPVASDAEG